jgi:hypothetical protein
MAIHDLDSQGETIREVVLPGQDETFNLLNGTNLRLVNVHGNATVNVPTLINEEGLLRTARADIDIVGIGGTTTVTGGVLDDIRGAYFLYHSDLNLNIGHSHHHWTSTGLNVADHYSNAIIRTDVQDGGGSFLVRDGSFLSATIEFSTFLGGEPLTIEGGKVLATGAPGVASQITNDVTFLPPPSSCQVNAFTIRDDFIKDPTSFSLKDDFLQVFNSAGGVVASVKGLHNQSGEPIQVDSVPGQPGSITIIADATPRPGMLPEITS